MKRVTKHLLYALYLAAVPAVSVWPRRALPAAPGFVSFAHADKGVHFAMYAVMSFLGGQTFFQLRLRRFPFAAFLFASVYGIVMEFMQAVAGAAERSATCGDVIANVMGALFGALLLMGWCRLHGTNRRRRAIKG